MLESTPSAIIVNDHQLLSDFIARVLQEQGFEAIRTFVNPSEALAFCHSNPPRLLVLDMMLPLFRNRKNERVDQHHPYILMDCQTSFRIVREVRKKHPQTKILLVTGERHPHTFHLGFEAGAHGIASKLDNLDDFIQILKRVMKGERDVTSARMAKLLEGYRAAGVPQLTETEVRILELVQEGLESREIGRCLGYSAKTVRNALTRINEKLGTSNRYEALAVATDMGLVGWRMGSEKNY